MANMSQPASPTVCVGILPLTAPSARVAPTLRGRPRPARKSATMTTPAARANCGSATMPSGHAGRIGPNANAASHSGADTSMTRARWGAMPSCGSPRARQYRGGSRRQASQRRGMGRRSSRLLAILPKAGRLQRMLLGSPSPSVYCLSLRYRRVPSSCSGRGGKPRNPIRSWQYTRPRMERETTTPLGIRRQQYLRRPQSPFPLCDTSLRARR